MFHTGSRFFIHLQGLVYGGHMEEQTNAPASEPEKKGSSRTAVVIASIVLVA